MREKCYQLKKYVGVQKGFFWVMAEGWSRYGTRENIMKPTKPTSPTREKGKEEKEKEKRGAYQFEEQGMFTPSEHSLLRWFLQVSITPHNIFSVFRRFRLIFFSRVYFESAFACVQTFLASFVPFDLLWAGIEFKSMREMRRETERRNRATAKTIEMDDTQYQSEEWRSY